MAFRVRCATKTETLVADLVEDLCAPGDPAELRSVLLPSRPLVERIHTALARRRGVAMGVEFLLPGAFFDRVAGHLGLPPLDPCWSPEGMFWRLLPAVRDASLQPDTRLASARGDARALLVLTRQIADRFDQYLHYRPEMVRAWDLGLPWEGLPEGALQDEDWQRALWRTLATLPDGRDAPPHLARRFEDLRHRLERSGDGPFPGSLDVLTTGPLPGGTLDALAVLGRRTEVRLRVLLPSREFLSDLRSAASQRRHGEAVDLEREGHPLLASLGRQAQDAFRELDRLLEREGGDFDALEEPDDADLAPTLLHRLQADIRAARPPDPALDPPAGPDDSLSVHLCAGPRREVEVLRDALRQAFDTLEDLRPEDVLVLTPDLETHAPLVQALFAAPAYRLPLSVSETHLPPGAPAAEFLRGALRFSGGRATLSEGLALLELPASAAAIGEDAAEELKARLRGAGITFGLDGAHRAALGAGGEDAGTWARGVERLFEGLWLGEGTDAARPDGSRCLPKAGTLGSGRGPALAALRWMDRLLAHTRAWRAADATPAQWAARLRALATELFEGRDLDLEPVGALASALERASADFGCRLPLGPDALVEGWLAPAEEEQRAVRPTAGAIALGGLKPLRALPCRVLAVLGLSDGAFPRRDDAPAWDLLAARHRAGDRNPREEDRQLFLDALLSARDRVLFTAPARHPVTDQAVPLSVCLEELLRTAAATLGGPAEGLVRRPPRQGFAPNNFGPEGSFDPLEHALAQAASGPARPRPFRVDGEGTPGERPARLEDVLKVLADPAAARLHALGVRPPAEAEDPREGDSEPLSLDPKDQGRLAAEVLRALPAGEGAERLARRLAADRRIPYGALGRQQVLRLAGSAARALEALRSRFGPWTRGEVQADGLPLRGDLRLAQGRSLILLESRRWERPHAALAAYASACLAAASGARAEVGVMARPGSGPARFTVHVGPAPAADAARAALETLVAAAARAGGGGLLYHPALSAKLLEAKDGAPPDLEDLEAWELGSAFPLLWRDRDPFAGELLAAWKAEAEALLAPALDWQAGFEAVDV